MWLVGRPLSNAVAEHQTIGKGIGLAVFASDALSSTAYATQEILFVLALAGTAAFAYSMPIAVAIVALLAIVTISYEQTLYAYPGGGGAYVVARDNLGSLPSQVAGGALLTDYVLGRGGVGLGGRGPDRVRLPRPHGVAGLARGGVRDAGHDHEPARREGGGRGVRDPDLLLPGRDVRHRRPWASIGISWACWGRCPTRRRSSCTARPRR